ncbi:MAG TPA: hypothetical protein VLC92_01245 [Rhodocyclaceae bacterium]|nr:hypothetical protein [Rhodocyclaceae bacterium]
MSDPASNQALSQAVLTQMRKDWLTAREWLQAVQGWPDTDIADITATLAKAVESNDTAELLSWSVWLATKAADARRAGWIKARQEEGYRAMLAAERATTAVEWKVIADGLRVKHHGEDKSRMSRARP